MSLTLTRGLRPTAPLRLNQNIEDNTVLIGGSPEVLSCAVDLEEDLAEMPFVSDTSKSFPETVGILLAEVITPDSFGDDLARKPVTTVRIVRHSFSIATEATPT